MKDLHNIQCIHSMTVQQLIEHLQQFPPDLEVWVSDGGYCEGATKCIAPEKKIAWEAGLDGDEVGDEWVYDKMSSYWESQGYTEVEHELLSKEIVLLKSTLDE